MSEIKNKNFKKNELKKSKSASNFDLKLNVENDSSMYNKIKNKCIKMH